MKEYLVTLEFRGHVEADSEEEALRIAHEEHASTFECFNWAVTVAKEQP